jgi:CAAX protease family protein
MLAVVEVIVVFSLTHIAYRSLKHFTPIGHWEAAGHTNFTPGLMMIVVSAAMIWWRGSHFAKYGLTFKSWAANVAIGLLIALALTGGAGALAALHLRPNHPLTPPSLREASIYAAGAIVLLVVMAVALRRRTDLKTIIPPPMSVAVLAILLALPVGIGWHFGAPVAEAILMVMWCFFGAGCGEEIFFRGYVQSRVNDACGRPWQVAGIPCGWGIVVSSLLFGWVHALNTVDYFHGRFDFAWAYGAQNVVVGLCYGALREKTGSILAGVVVHGLADAWARVPAMMHA